eukprot:Colp12_sorted_trinity150504_noHs@27551
MALFEKQKRHGATIHDLFPHNPQGYCRLFSISSRRSASKEKIKKPNATTGMSRLLSLGGLHAGHVLVSLGGDPVTGQTLVGQELRAAGAGASGVVLRVDLGAVEEHLGLEVVVEGLLSLQRVQRGIRLRQVRQLGGAVRAGSGLVQQAGEGVGPGHALSEGLHALVGQAEELVGGGEDGGGVELRGEGGLLAAQALGHDGVLLDPGGDRDRGDADAQLVEGEAVGGHLAVAGDADVGRHDVVVEAAVLVVSDEEQRLLPLGARADRLVHLLDQLLALNDRSIGVLPVGEGVAVGGGLGLQPREVGQGASSHIGVELGIKLVQVLDVLGGVGVLEVEQCPGVLLVVTREGATVLHQVVEVRLLGPQSAVEVGDHSLRGAGHRKSAVGVGGARDGAVPVVEHGELLSELVDDGRRSAVEHGHRVGLVARVGNGVVRKAIHGVPHVLCVD